MPTATTGPTLQNRIDNVSSLHHGTRHLTLPPFVGGGVVVCSAALHYAWTWLQAVVWVIGAVLIITGYDHALRVPRASRPREWWWQVGSVTALTVGAIGWWWFGVLAWPWLGAQLVVTALLFFPCAIPWTLHRRVRRGVQVSTNVRAFSRDTLDGLGLRGVDAPMSSATADEDRWEIDLVPPPGWTLAKLQACIPAVAAYLGLPVGNVSIVEKAGRWGQRLVGRLMVDESSTAPTPNLWKLPQKPTDIRQPYRKGELTQGGPLRSEWWRKGHGAVAGLSGGLLGGGKTVEREIDAAYLATSHNALDPWIYDGKPGSPNWAPWAELDETTGVRLADWYTTTADGLKAMVMACWAIAETRGESSIHEPSKGKPFVGIICDEARIAFAPELLEATVRASDQARAERVANLVKEATERYIQTYRSTGTAIRMSTVRCEQKSTGGATIRSFLLGGERAGFLSSNQRDGDFIFPGYKTVRLDTINRAAKGTGYWQSFLHPEPVEARADLFDDHEIDDEHPDNDIRRLRRWKAQHPESSPVLKGRELSAVLAAVGDAYGARWDTSGDGPDGEVLDMVNRARREDPDWAKTVDAAFAQHGGMPPQEPGLVDDTATTPPATTARPRPEQAPTRYESNGHARAHTLEVLIWLGEGWHAASAVRDVLGEHKAQATVTNRLAELERDQLAERRGKRDRTEWRAAVTEVPDHLTRPAQDPHDPAQQQETTR